MYLLCRINFNHTQKNTKMKKAKDYIFRFFDKDQNETHFKIYQFSNIKDARKYARIMLWNSNDNTASIEVKNYFN